MTDLIALDDVDTQGREGWRIGETRCTRCDGYHQLWGILRLAHIVGGTRIDKELLSPILGQLIAPGARILIAGAADAGLLQFVLEATTARPLSIHIVDRCPAPLELIERIRLPEGVSVETDEADLTRFDRRDRYDLILSHSMLPFVDDATRVAILRRLRDSLADGGRLVLVARTAPVTAESATSEHDRAWRGQAAEKLALHPDLVDFCGETLSDRLDHFAAGRRHRGAYGFRDATDIADVLTRGGFTVESHIEGGDSTSLRLGDQRITKRSNIFVAAGA